MPNVWAITSGNWSTASIWNTGTLPTASDAVWASGSTVYINQDTNVISLNTTITGSIGAGGTFNCYSSRTISASINPGTTTALNITGSSITVNIVGTVSSSNTTSLISGISISSTNNSTININGSLSGGGAAGTQANAVTITSTSPTTLNVTGSVSAIQGGGSANSGYGISIGSTSATINVSGSILGGSAFQAYGINVAGTSNTVRITGEARGSVYAAITFGGTQNNLIYTGDMYAGTGGTGYGLFISVTNPYTSSIIGNAYNTTGAASPLQIANTGLGTVTMTGSINGGIGSTWYGANFSANNLTFNFTGSINGGGAGGSDARGLEYSSGGTNSILNIVGSVNGGAGGTGLRNEGVATINITGSVTGGPGAGTGNVGAYNSSTGVINITGSVTGGGSSTSYGALNSSTGTVRVTTAIASSFTSGLSNTLATGTASFESAIFASNGTSPWSGFCKIKSGSNNFITFATSDGGTKTIVDSNNVANGQPAASNVRLGTSYNFGGTIGTAAIPPANQVAAGIAIDNTTGSAILTAAGVTSAVWNTQTSALTTTGSIGERLKNSATVSSTGDQIAALTI